MDPPALYEELVEEIILRLPPDEPGTLVSAALVCKTWCRFISSPRFRRRFREIHGSAGAPMLGFFMDLWDGDGNTYMARFLRTSSSSCPPVADRRGAFAVDARHGRVLLETTPPSPPPPPPDDDEEADGHLVVSDAPDYNFVLWNPMTGKSKELPVLSCYENAVTAWKAAVLCAAAAAADHDVASCRCHDDDDDEHPFLVVLVTIAAHHVFVHVYDSSSTGRTSWNVTSCVHIGPLSDDCCIPMGEPGVLAAGALHFAIEDGRRILSYDLANRSLSLTPTPWNDRVGNLALVTTTTEDGRSEMLLGVAGVEGYNIHVWSYSPSSPDDDNDGSSSPAWTPRRTVELDHTMVSIDLAVPTTTSSSFRVVGFAEGANTVFVVGPDGIYAVTLESGGKVGKVHEPTHFFGVVPYVSFYTPDLGAY